MKIGVEERYCTYLLVGGVLDGGVVGEKFRGQVVLRDLRIVGRELIPLVTEAADPVLAHEVNSVVRVEHGAAQTTRDTIVGANLRKSNGERALSRILTLMPV